MGPGRSASDEGRGGNVGEAGTVVMVGCASLSCVVDVVVVVVVVLGGIGCRGEGGGTSCGESLGLGDSSLAPTGFREGDLRRSDSEGCFSRDVRGCGWGCGGCAGRDFRGSSSVVVEVVDPWFLAR